jgi:hypothetical protein
VRGALDERIGGLEREIEALREGRLRTASYKFAAEERRHSEAEDVPSFLSKIARH